MSTLIWTCFIIAVIFPLFSSLVTLGSVRPLPALFYTKDEYDVCSYTMNTVHGCSCCVSCALNHKSWGSVRVA